MQSNSKLWRLLRILVVALVTGLILFLIAGILVPLPPISVPEATRIYDANGSLIAGLFEEYRTEIPLSKIPENLQLAVLAIEDSRFYKHFGIDPIAILRAAWRDIMARKVVEGGSTITQQLAKTLFLSSERVFKRKAVEALLTIKLEMLYTKEQILEMYLNQIYWGKGAYGVEAASRVYFNKSAQALSLSESAFLAGLIRSPESYSPDKDTAAANARKNAVLDKMVQLLFIPKSAAETAKKETVTTVQKPSPPRGAPYFIDYIINQIRAVNSEVYSGLYRGGYKIYTSLDANMQKAAEGAFKGLKVRGSDTEGIPQPQGALVAVDPKTGFIKAMIGGTDFSVTQRNRSVDALRQPGSAFKLFLYTAVIDHWIPATSKQVCEEVTYPGRVPGEPWKPKDYGDEPYHWRPMGIREAIAISDNVVASRWAYEIGPSVIANYAKRMGISSNLRLDLSLALGTSEVSPLEMAIAASPLANGGYTLKPLAITKIEDRNGNTVMRNAQSISREFDPRVMYVVTDLFKSVLSPDGTGSHLASIINRPAAGKTGTTDNEKDAWFVGYTPDLVGVVWVGWDHSERSAGGSGSVVAGPIWANFMRNALESIPARDFPMPSGVIYENVCSITGLLPNETCPVTQEVFIKGTEPKQIDPIEHFIEIIPEPSEDQMLPDTIQDQTADEPELSPIDDLYAEEKEEEF